MVAHRHGRAGDRPRPAIVQATGQMRKIAQEVAQAVGEQGRAARDIIKAAQTTSKLAAQVRKAGEEQARTAAQIRRPPIRCGAARCPRRVRCRTGHDG